MLLASSGVILVGLSATKHEGSRDTGRLERWATECGSPVGSTPPEGRSPCFRYVLAAPRRGGELRRDRSPGLTVANCDSGPARAGMYRLKFG